MDSSVFRMGQWQTVQTELHLGQRLPVSADMVQLLIRFSITKKGFMCLSYCKILPSTVAFAIPTWKIRVNCSLAFFLIHLSHVQ